ncbi:transmembrane anchor protein [Brevundimonas sp.]|uniref:transmembrane anchor protein n=1 Tax=Brevundimonas sp. TaxID=1871086 RepID=UPI002ED90395
MYNANRPAKADLPSTAQLLKSTGIAAVVASVLLVTVVLPAEYGVDPTRIGSVFGLTEMGRIKRQLAEEAAADAAADAAAAKAAPVSQDSSPAAAAPTAPPAEAAPVPQTPSAASPNAASTTPSASSPAAQPAAKSDRTSITLEPDEGAEVKLVMKSGARANFTWASDGGAVNYDTHGDGAGISYHGYGKGTEQRLSGVLTAAFDGKHGWFWRNRTDEAVTITLTTSGNYEKVEFID